ncbi:MAG: TolC family protein [Acidobacteriota bacterium]|nr:TolC family protein [Acidobacteriota bacterium]
MSRMNRTTLIAATLVVAFAGLPGLYAQKAAAVNSESAYDQAIANAYTHQSWFPNVLGPYTNPQVPALSLANSQLLGELIEKGTLHLSLQDAIALAVENNLDIAVARYNPQYAQIDKVRASSGQATRGVQGAFSSSALFAGALGGGVGAASGGFQQGAAGSALGGVNVTRIGSVGSFDPVIGFSAGWAYSQSPLASSVVNGVSLLTGNTGDYNVFFGQEFPTGTSYSVSMGGARLSTNSITNIFNPQVVTAMTVGIQQPLLNGFGRRANAKFIRIAENDIGISKDYFREQVASTIGTIMNDYWTLAEDKQNVGVAEEAEKYDEKLLSDNKRQVQIGTMAPIDVIQAESALATAQQNLIVAQTTYRQQQEIIKTALSKQVSGPLLTALVEPTTPLPEPKPSDVLPLEEAINAAHANRPEIDLNDLNLKNEEVVLKANRNALLPTLDAFASFTPSGLSGSRIEFAQGAGFAPGARIGKVPGGLGDALSDVFHNRYPNYSIGFTLAMPIRNRAAQADAARALLEEHYLRTTVQQSLNKIDQDVRTAEIGVVQGKARVDAAKKAVQYARQQLVDEQKKFAVGESTVTLVIQMQNSLTTAEGTLVTARAGYAQALTTYQQATGTILKDNNVELVEALTGRFNRNPNIPGTPISGSSSPANLLPGSVSPVAR